VSDSPKSTPEIYCSIRVGLIKQCTPGKLSHDPRWNTHLEFVLNTEDGISQLLMECWRKYASQPDEFLGRSTIHFDEVLTAAEKGDTKVVDEWFVLRDTISGMVHLRLNCTMEETFVL